MLWFVITQQLLEISKLLRFGYFRYFLPMKTVLSLKENLCIILTRMQLLYIYQIFEYTSKDLYKIHHKLVIPFLIKFLYLDWCIDLRHILLKKRHFAALLSQRHNKIIPFRSCSFYCLKQRWISRSKCALQNNCFRINKKCFRNINVPLVQNSKGLH